MIKLTRKDRDILKVNNNWNRIMIKDGDLHTIKNNPSNCENTNKYVWICAVSEVDMEEEKLLYNTGSIYR